MGSKILIPACTTLNSFHKVLTVEHTSPDHSTQVFIISRNGIHQIKRQLHVCEAEGFLKTTNLPEVILLTIALSVSYNHENILKMKHKLFTLGGFVRGVFVGGICPGGGGVVLEPLDSVLLYLVGK